MHSVVGVIFYYYIFVLFYHYNDLIFSIIIDVITTGTRAALSQGWPHSAAANFGTYRSLQRHRAVFTAIATLSN